MFEDVDDAECAASQVSPGDATTERVKLWSTVSLNACNIISNFEQLDGPPLELVRRRVTMTANAQRCIQDLKVTNDTCDDEWNLTLPAPMDILTHVYYCSDETEDTSPSCPNERENPELPPEEDGVEDD